MSLELIKRALVHDPDERGTLIIQCCGNKIPRAIPPVIAGTVCSTCGNVYDAWGWVIDNTRKPFRRNGND